MNYKYILINTLTRAEWNKHNDKIKSYTIERGMLFSRDIDTLHPEVGLVLKWLMV